jgi:thymidine kinase
MWARVYLILGPMFSGKTSELLRRYKRSVVSGVPVLLIKYVGDTRYSDSKISTHDGDMNPADVSCRNLMDAWPHVMKLLEKTGTPVVYIDEIQFFNDKLEFCDKVARLGIEVHAAGLSSDYLRKPFPQMGELMALAYSVVYLHAVCYYCKCDRACYSLKYVASAVGQEDIGGSEKYHAVCTGCYGERSGLLPTS